MLRLRPVVLILQVSGRDDVMCELDRTSVFSLLFLRTRAAELLGEHDARMVSEQEIRLRALERAPRAIGPAPGEEEETEPAYIFGDSSSSNSTIDSLAVALQATALQVTSSFDVDGGV